MKKRKKRPLTLLEVMIVIFLIGLIGSVVGYNMKGSLDKGRVFKTEKAAEQIHDILMLEVAQGTSIDDVMQDPATYLAQSGMVKDPQEMLKDGWGEAFVFVKDGSSDFGVKSEKLNKYKTRQKQKKAKAQDGMSSDAQEEE
jgi:general secretion pathway protein G